jgi:hypothetical protein
LFAVHLPGSKSADFDIGGGIRHAYIDTRHSD